MRELKVDVQNQLLELLRPQTQGHQATLFPCHWLFPTLRDTLSSPTLCPSRWPSPSESPSLQVTISSPDIITEVDSAYIAYRRNIGTSAYMAYILHIFLHIFLHFVLHIVLLHKILHIFCLYCIYFCIYSAYILHIFCIYSAYILHIFCIYSTCTYIIHIFFSSPCSTCTGLLMGFTMLL